MLNSYISNVLFISFSSFRWDYSFRTTFLSCWPMTRSTCSVVFLYSFLFRSFILSNGFIRTFDRDELNKPTKKKLPENETTWTALTINSMDLIHTEIKAFNEKFDTYHINKRHWHRLNKNQIISRIFQSNQTKKKSNLSNTKQFHTRRHIEIPVHVIVFLSLFSISFHSTSFHVRTATNASCLSVASAQCRSQVYCSILVSPMWKNDLYIVLDETFIISSMHLLMISFRFICIFFCHISYINSF